VTTSVEGASVVNTTVRGLRRLILGEVAWQLRLLARHDALEPVPIGAAQMLEQPRRRPACGHDRAVPRLLVQPLDDRQHRFALAAQKGRSISSSASVS
jgi:hypothetical protein